MRVALAGNPNSGKTTLFNALTGANQYVGNWPGVTVEKKEGKLKADKSIEITDLPGIYSLSPYTLEEVVARNFILEEHPDAILNIVDGSNLERNLYLTLQLLTLRVPTVLALNMMDELTGNGGSIDVQKMAQTLGVPVVAVGVPTVVDARTLCADLSGAEIDLPEDTELFVTPRDIDTRVRDSARLVGYAIDLALHDALTIKDIDMFLA